MRVCVFAPIGDARPSLLCMGALGSGCRLGPTLALQRGPLTSTATRVHWGHSLSSPSQPALPPGAVAGIVVGSLSLVPLVALLWLYRRQRRRHRNLFGQVCAPATHTHTCIFRFLF